jgi:hypothetical protein
MSRQHHWKRPVPERVRRSVATVTRRYYLAFTAVAVAVAVSVSLAPRGLSEAATAAATPSAAASGSPAPTDDGLTWSPSTDAPYQGANSAGCQLYSYDTVSMQDHSTAMAVYDALAAEAPDQFTFDGSTVDSQMVLDSAPTGDSFGVYPDAQVPCSWENNNGDAYVKKLGYGSVGQYAQAAVDAYLHPAPAGSRARAEQQAVLLGAPAWLKTAVGILVGTIAFVGVSVAAVAAMVALGAATTESGGLTSPFLAALAGCIGDVVSVPVGFAVAGVEGGKLGLITAGVSACLTGGLIGTFPSSLYGKYLGTAVQGVFGAGAAATIPEVIGSGAVATAEAAALVDLTPVATAIADVEAAAAQVAATGG